jgi:2-polyprenyl-3-methyl-5-hydroxy-6-metoxy-1,4-benzoquinol methylase
MDRQNHRWLRGIAGFLADSILFSRGRRLYHLNRENWNYPMSKWDKLACGGYMILKDYSQGEFPPTFEDQAKAYENEINFSRALPGMTQEEVQRSQVKKPFWNAQVFIKYNQMFGWLWRTLEQLGVTPGQTVLELGCGTGWMAEFLAMGGYSVVATTISHHDVGLAERRIRTVKEKGVTSRLHYVIAPMEKVNSAVSEHIPFDAAFVFEALHHAYDWKQALHSAGQCLKPGAWLILANEPNVLHTMISYRVAKLSKTHEIGFSGRELRRELVANGFDEVQVIQPRVNNWITPHWIAARKRDRA